MIGRNPCQRVAAMSIQHSAFLPRVGPMLAVALVFWLGSEAHAAQQCASSLTQTILSVQGTIDALQSGPSSNWMHDELRLISEACARGGDLEAAWRVEKLQGQLASARSRQAAARGTRGSCQATSRAEFTCDLSADTRAGRRMMKVEPTPSRLSANTSP